VFADAPSRQAIAAVQLDNLRIGEKNPIDDPGVAPWARRWRLERDPLKS
jgi:hypothetical protein